MTLKLQALELWGHLDSRKALGRHLSTNSSGTRDTLGLSQFFFFFSREDKGLSLFGQTQGRRVSEVNMAIDWVVMFGED